MLKKPVMGAISVSYNGGVCLGHGLLEENGRETKFRQNNVGADLFKCLYLDEELVFGENLFTRCGEIYLAFQ